MARIVPVSTPIRAPSPVISGSSSSITAPTLVRKYTFASALGNLSETRKWTTLPVLAGNALILFIACNDTHDPVVVDNGSDGGSYTVHQNFHSVPFSARICVVSRLNITDAPTEISISWGGSNTNNFTNGVALEYCGIASSSAYDTGTGAAGTSTAPAPGSITTATDNELVLSFVQQLTGESMDPFVKGSGNTLLCSDLVDGIAAQAQVKATAGSVNPGMTLPASMAWMAVSAAFKYAAVGTLRPSTGVQVVGWHHQQIRAKVGTSGDYSAGNYFLQFPISDGNKLYAAFIGAQPITTITDTESNTWTPTGALLAISGGSGGMRCYYCDAPTLADDLTLTVALTDNGVAPGHTMHLVELTGVASGLAVHQQSTSVNNSTNDVTGVSLTPATANGIVFNTFGEQDETAISIDIGQFMTSTDRPSSPSPWPNDENNGWSFYLNPNTSPFAVTWHSDGIPGGWGSIADAFNAS